MSLPVAAASVRRAGRRVPARAWHARSPVTTSMRSPAGCGRGISASSSAPCRPAPTNAITDVDGVLVGHATIVRGEGALKVGERPGAHRGDRGAAAAGHLVHLGLRRHLHPERRRRDDRHALDPRSRDAGASASSSPTPAASARCTTRHRLHDRAPSEARLGVPAGGGRDMGRHAQRRARPARAEGARLRGARRRPRRRWWPRATSAAAPA